MRTSTRTGALFALLLAASIAGCAPIDPAVEVSTEAIVNGTAETGSPAVMLLYNQAGGLCTSSLITPRVVLTARHCVTQGGGSTVASASSISLYVGSSQRALTAQYRARAIYVIPGSSGSIGDGRAQDVALIELATPARETPMEISFASPSTILGARATAIGFGQTPSGNNSSTKYRVDTTVDGYQQGLIFVPPTVCQGDSGGPLVGPDGQIYGVASFIYSPDGRTEPQCGTAPGAYNEIYRHQEWIQGILEMVGDACFPDEAGEVCDGADNDCDGEADEGCMPLGTACTDSATCIGALCAATQAGTICTQACDPMRPDLGCPPGFFCGSTGCAGHCVPGGPGALPINAECTTDTDCASLFCADPGDGRQRCLAPCQLDSGRCLAGEICVPLADACGGCVDQDLVGGFGHGLGEPCEADADCRSGSCREHAGIRECTAPCTDACPSGFSCREGECVRTPSGQIGAGCGENADCGGGICAAFGDRRWCTATCTDSSTCPAGYGCAPAGGVSVCAPMGELVGEGCDADADCASGVCARVGESGVCTEACGPDRACGAGFECRRTADGAAAACTRPASTSGGGCAIDPGATGTSAATLVPVLAALAIALRRRRRA